MTGGHRYNGQYTPPHWHMVPSQNPGANTGTGPRLLPVSCVGQPPQTCSLNQEVLPSQHRKQPNDNDGNIIWWLAERARTIEEPDCMQVFLVLTIPGPDNGALCAATWGRLGGSRQRWWCSGAVNQEVLWCCGGVGAHHCTATTATT